MARLIVVAGASGARKTFMLTQLENYRDDIVSIKNIQLEGLGKMNQMKKLLT